MPASLSATDPNVTQSETARKNAPPTSRPRARGAVVSFTRHKRELARLVALEVRAAVRFVVHVLLCHADADGVAWTGLETIRQLMPRSGRRKVYNERTVRLALIEARSLGLLHWETVPAFGRFPRRDRSTHKAVFGEGRWTQSGGRIFFLHLAQLRGEPSSAPSIGTESGGPDLQILAGPDLQIPPTDPLCSLREHLKKIPRTPQAAAPPVAARPPQKKASETPSARGRTQAVAEPPRTAGGGRAEARDRKRVGDGRGEERPRGEAVDAAAIAAFAETLKHGSPPGRRP